MSVTIAPYIPSGASTSAKPSKVTESKAPAAQETRYTKSEGVRLDEIATQSQYTREGVLVGDEFKSYPDRDAQTTPQMMTHHPKSELKADTPKFIEKDYGFYKRFESTEDNSWIRSSQTSRNIYARLEGEKFALQAFGGISKGMTHGVVQVGNHPPQIFVSPIIDSLLGKLEKMHNKNNLFKVAIVTDGVISMGKQEFPDNLRTVDYAKEQTVDRLYHIYKGLIEEGYQRIISLHLSPKLSKSLNYAHLAAEMVSSDDIEIKIINSHSNGLGLGLIVREIHRAIINHYSPMDIYHLVQSCVAKLRYMVMPLSFDYQKNQKWVAKLSGSQTDLLGVENPDIPIVSLAESLQLETTVHTDSDGLQYVLSQIASYYESRQKMRRIGIEHRQQPQLAQKLKQLLKQRYPNIPVSTHLAGSVTNALFGPRLLGVCII